MSTTLTAPETRRFAALEEKVAEHIGSFFEAAKALAEIRDSRFYRETHATFEAYCKDRWKMSRSRAYQLIASAEVVETLSTNGGQGLPDSERVARPLTKLPEAERAEAWQAAVDAEPSGPTAETVEAVVAERLADAIEAPASAWSTTRRQCPNCGGYDFADDETGEYCRGCLEPMDSEPEPPQQKQAKPTKVKSTVVAQCQALWDALTPTERIFAAGWFHDQLG